MCEVWPGPRCSHDMGEKVTAHEAGLQKVLQRYGPDSHEYAVAKAKLDVAKQEWYATKRGIEELEAQLKLVDNPLIQTALDRAVLTRAMQTNALKEIQRGRLSQVAALSGAGAPFYDQAEMESVVEAAREYQENIALKTPNVRLTAVDEQSYRAFVYRLRKNVMATQNGNFTSEQQIQFDKLLAATPPDQVTMATYNFVQRAMDRSQKQLRKEVARISAIQGVTRPVAQAYYEAYRKQYTDLYANLKEKDKPDPPALWVRGDLPYSGYTKDPNSNFAPRDPASLYAAFRLRSDPAAVPDFLKTSRGVAAVDLETASPLDERPNGTGWDPKNGRIIEFGIVSFNPRGKETATYQQLVKPDQAFLDAHGTGNVAVHNIHPADLTTAPNINRVIPAVRKALEGKVLIPHNAPFEMSWLSEHVPGFEADDFPHIDTLDMARKHLDLPNYRLATVCAANGVAYGGATGEAHRAGHDAKATGLSYFKMQRYIKKTWNASNARKNAAILSDLPIGSRWDTWRPLVPYKNGTRGALR